MHISEYGCKTCLKNLGILLKCRETFEKFLAACNSSKNTGLPQFFSKVFWQLHFKNISLLTKTESAYYADFYEFKTTRWLANIWQAIPHFPNILVRTWALLFIYFAGVYEIYIKCKKTSKLIKVISSYNICSGIKH